MILLVGCVATHNPQPADTEFKDSERNWLEIYRRELIICINNGDAEGFHFFMQEIKNEKRRLKLEKALSK